MSPDPLEVFERLIKTEEKLAASVDRHAVLVSEMGGVRAMMDQVREEVVSIRTLLEANSLGEQNRRVQILWAARESTWRILNPILNSLLTGGAVLLGRALVDLYLFRHP